MKQALRISRFDLGQLWRDDTRTYGRGELPDLLARLAPEGWRLAAIVGDGLPWSPLVVIVTREVRP